MQLSHSVTDPVKFKFVGTTALSVVSRVVKRPPWLPWSARGGGGGGDGGRVGGCGGT